LDNEIMGLVSSLTDVEKMKLIETLKIWKDA